jgi:glutamyl-tRNA reductase
MTVHLVGLSHHVAPVELRERLALDLEGARALAAHVASDGREAVCLSTCNRTELYLTGEGAHERAVVALGELAGNEEVVRVLHGVEGEAAARHLFRVAAGLDSMIPGEAEILGQVRSAYEAGVAGPILDRLFRQALHVGKKARSETAIAASPASISSAAAALAEQVFGDLRGRRVLVIGAGKAGELAARSLASRGAEISSAASRTARDSLHAALRAADVVISATSARGFVLTREDMADALRRRRGRPLFLVDIAVPRDLDPEIKNLDGCYLYDIDDLEAVVDESLAARTREAARAEALAAEEAERFRRWQASREVVPAIASLRARAERIRTAELARAEGRLARLSDPERRAVESITAQIVNKLLHLPTVRMKEAAATADGAVYADALEHLFGLEEER